MPPINPPKDVDSINGEDLEDFAIETHEWLSLVSLDSPRIDPDNKIDSFLSRYAAPGESRIRSKLVRISWRGFLPPIWVHETFVEALLLTPRDSWLACSVVGFEEGWSCESKDCTILRPPGAPNEYVLWEIVS
jgi:ribonuclease P/MRP protein subunit RPP40